jgi:hypothetical protein
METLQDERWGDGMQQDAQEFLHGVLNQLQVRDHFCVCGKCTTSNYKY